MVHDRKTNGKLLSFTHGITSQCLAGTGFTVRVRHPGDVAEDRRDVVVRIWIPRIATNV